MNRTRRRLGGAAVALALVGAVLGGCSDEEAASAELCTAYSDITTAFAADEPDLKAVKSNLDTVKSEAPEEIEDELKLVIDATNKLVNSKGEDSSAFEDPQVLEARSTSDEFIYENCDFDNKLEVEAKNYSYTGIPKEMSSGENAILLSNTGTEAHELLLLKKKDGITESFEDLLKLDEEAAREKVDRAGGTFVPTKGSKSLAIVDLEAGDYVGVCFIPVGTKISDEGPQEGNGPPHFTQGMKEEFTVSG